jgi:ABC-type Fe3+ transport system substrate-binding protein
VQKGAPVNYFLTEGAGAIGATAVFKNAPHPNTAWLFARWLASEEGQKAYGWAVGLPRTQRLNPLTKLGLRRSIPLARPS